MLDIRLEINEEKTHLISEGGGEGVRGEKWAGTHFARPFEIF